MKDMLYEAVDAAPSAESTCVRVRMRVMCDATGHALMCWRHMSAQVNKTVLNMSSHVVALTDWMFSHRVVVPCMYMDHHSCTCRSWFYRNLRCFVSSTRGRFVYERYKCVLQWRTRMLFAPSSLVLTKSSSSFARKSWLESTHAFLVQYIMLCIS